MPNISCLIYCSTDVITDTINNTDAVIVARIAGYGRTSRRNDCILVEINVRVVP